MQAQLVIPATTGADACTRGGWSEIQASASQITHNSGSPSSNAVQVVLPEMTLSQYRSLSGRTGTSFARLGIAVQKNPNGTAAQEIDLGSVSSSQTINARTVTFGMLEKNARYVINLYVGTPASPVVRLCFKTRGQFSNAEQKLVVVGGELQLDFSKSGGFGCYAIAKTRQDIQECMCYGTRGGSRFNTTTATRQALGCRDTS